MVQVQSGLNSLLESLKGNLISPHRITTLVLRHYALYYCQRDRHWNIGRRKHKKYQNNFTKSRFFQKFFLKVETATKKLNFSWMCSLIRHFLKAERKLEILPHFFGGGQNSKRGLFLLVCKFQYLLLLRIEVGRFQNSVIRL